MKNIIGYIIIVLFIPSIETLAQKTLTNEIYYVYNKTEINNIKKLVIYIKSDDKQLDNIFQDALSTRLKAFNWNVVDREHFEAEVSKDYQVKQKKAQADSSDIVPLTMEQMASLVNVNYYMIIDYVIAKKRYSNPVGRSGEEGTEKIVISGISFRIFNIGAIDALAVGVIDFIVGETPIIVANSIKELIDKMK